MLKKGGQEEKGEGSVAALDPAVSTVPAEVALSVLPGEMPFGEHP